MKLSRSLCATVTALATIAAGLFAAPAHAAYPTSPIDVGTDGGYVHGGIIWYNRSVGLQGYVTDLHSSVGGYTQVRFHFYIDADTQYGEPVTRTALYGTTKQFNFTAEGPAGGIKIVGYELCSPGGVCRNYTPEVRPTS